MARAQTFIGIDIGGTKSAVILGMRMESNAGAEIAVADRVAFPTEAHQPADRLLEKIFQNIKELLRRGGRTISEVQSIGISCGGPLDSRRGIILNPPNLPVLHNTPIVDLIQEKLGVPARLQNDANACALAEWMFGAARGYRNVVFLTFGTGMGAGLILDGRLYSGVNDMAGEVGHVRLAEIGPVGYGKAGSFEGFCSGGGLAQLARIKALEKLQEGSTVGYCRDASELEGISAKTAADAASAGDPLALEVFRLCGHYLGKGLAILIDILNPEVIVLGSIFLRTRELLWPSCEAVLDKECLSLSRQACAVVPAGLGERIGDYAALSVAAYQEQ